MDEKTGKQILWYERFVVSLPKTLAKQHDERSTRQMGSNL